MTDFAKLVPVNGPAQKLFSRSVEYMRQQDDTFHLQFIDEAVIDVGANGMAIHDRGDDSGTEYHSSSSSELDPNRGHYLLSLRAEKLPGQPAQGWRVGKGSSHASDHNVDFLMAPPKDSKRKHLAIIHMFFQFNLRSGMLMLVAASPERPVLLYTDGEWIALRYPAKRVLHLRSNKIRLGQYEYDLIYTVSSTGTHEFFAGRNAYMRIFSDRPSPPGNLWSVPPNAGFSKMGSIYVCSTKACGGFGWVYEGVDSLTGDPVAVKELAIKDKTVRDQVLAEAQMGQTFQSLPGILPTIHTWCEHDQSRPCGKLPEKVFISSPLARTDFAMQSWDKVDYDIKIRLFWRTLKGLESLHKVGIMHRDITRKNLLVLSLDPPDAALCDYGKATKAQQNADTHIGPIHTLAPEVYEQSYTNKIDIWAWGYAMAEVLGYRRRTDKRIDPRRLSEIHQWLSLRDNVTECEAELSDLCRGMLSWNRESRPTAESALKHPCWAALGEEDRDSAEDDEEALRPTKVQVVVKPKVTGTDRPSAKKLSRSTRQREGPESHHLDETSTPSTVPMTPPAG